MRESVLSRIVEPRGGVYRHQKSGGLPPQATEKIKRGKPHSNPHKYGVFAKYNTINPLKG